MRTKQPTATGHRQKFSQSVRRTFARDDDAGEGDAAPIAGVERAASERQVAVDVGYRHDCSLGAQVLAVKHRHQEVEHAVDRGNLLQLHMVRLANETRGKSDAPYNREVSLVPDGLRNHWRLLKIEHSVVNHD